MLIQFSIQDNEAHNFAITTNKVFSGASSVDLKNFYIANEDFINFNFFCGKIFEEYIKQPNSLINRTHLIQFYKFENRLFVIFIFILKWFLILYYRYIQIFYLKEYDCINEESQNSESNYWIREDGKKCAIIEYIYPKYIRIIYVFIYDIIFSCFYGLYFLIYLEKTNWRKSYVVGLQIVEYILLIILFSFSFLYKNNCNDKHILIKQNYYDYIYLILVIIVNFIK